MARLRLSVNVKGRGKWQTDLRDIDKIAKYFVTSEVNIIVLSSLKMISANQRPDYCRDFSRNRDSVMISDEITDSLVSLLKVSYKNITFISVESLYYFKEN